jgi:hypothetical protein
VFIWYTVFTFISCLNWYPILAAEYRSDYCLWGSIYTEFSSSHCPIMSFVCLPADLLFNTSALVDITVFLYFCFYYVRPDCLLVLYWRKTELILSLIRFININTTFSTYFIVARIYIVPKMRLNNEKCHFILLPELSKLKNVMKDTTNCDTRMETSSKPTRG